MTKWRARIEIEKYDGSHSMLETFHNDKVSAQHWSWIRNGMLDADLSIKKRRSTIREIEQ